MGISSEKKTDIGNKLDLVVSPITQMIHLTNFFVRLELRYMINVNCSYMSSYV